MADLTTKAFWHCDSFQNVLSEVRGSKGAVYFVSLSPANRGEYGTNWACTCKGFQFRGDCKHVVAAKKAQCGWSQFMSGGEPTVDENGDNCCPECGGPVSAMNWGV